MHQAINLLKCYFLTNQKQIKIFRKPKLIERKKKKYVCQLFSIIFYEIFTFKFNYMP